LRRTMRAWPVVLLSTAVLGTACTSSSGTDTDLFTAEHAVDCRELGGGWVYVRYERDDEVGTRVGYGLEEEAAESATDAELEEAERRRAASGWDDEALDDLARPEAEVPAEIRARLERMPSCLVELGGPVAAPR
jgi:nucleotide-binding universal stress UspA family protein